MITLGCGWEVIRQRYTLTRNMLHGEWLALTQHHHRTDLSDVECWVPNLTHTAVILYSSNSIEMLWYAHGKCEVTSWARDVKEADSNIENIIWPVVTQGNLLISHWHGTSPIPCPSFHVSDRCKFPQVFQCNQHIHSSQVLSFHLNRTL